MHKTTPLNNLDQSGDLRFSFGVFGLSYPHLKEDAEIGHAMRREHASAFDCFRYDVAWGLEDFLKKKEKNKAGKEGWPLALACPMLCYVPMALAQGAEIN